jgi:hypothetical protein
MVAHFTSHPQTFPHVRLQPWRQPAQGLRAPPRTLEQLCISAPRADMKSKHRATIGRETAITGYARGKATAQHSLDNSNAALVQCWAVDHSSEVELIGIPILPKHGCPACLQYHVSSSEYCSACGLLLHRVPGLDTVIVGRFVLRVLLSSMLH